MSRSATAAEPAQHFDAVVAAMSAMSVRPELIITPTPPPRKIAPLAAAFAAHVAAPSHDDPLAQGRFVLLHDPEEPEEWQGPWRAVTYIRADVEPDIGSDELSGEVTWTWLSDALEASGCAYQGFGGTVTVISSTSFGELAQRPRDTEIEVRASWSPMAQEPQLMARHFLAWGQAMSSIAGLPPVGDVVVALHPRSTPPL